MQAHPPKTRDRAAALLPPLFFAPAVGYFVAALALGPSLVDALRVHFYQARVLAVLHMLTLGWVSMTMFGVLYRYVPAITKRGTPRPRVAVAQWVTFQLGVAGLVTHFWLGSWTGVAWAAGLLTVSALLLCGNLWPLLRSAPRRGVAEVGILLATTLLVMAAVLGLLLAVDKTRPLLGGSTLTNIGAHAHLAALGWGGITVSALSFRFLPAFLLPTLDATRPARWLVMGLAAAVLVLAGTLLARSSLVTIAAGIAAGIVAAYVVLAIRVLASRRMPLDWTAAHAIASLVWCLAAVAAGLGLLAVGGQSEAGARLGAAYGVAAVLGWFSNLVIGVSYKLFPGFIAAARAERGRPPVPMASLGVTTLLQRVVWTSFNAGVAATVVGLLLDVGPVLLTGTVVLAVAALAYGGGSGRTLAFAVVDPRRSNPLAVLP